MREDLKKRKAEAQKLKFNNVGVQIFGVQQVELEKLASDSSANSSPMKSNIMSPLQSSDENQ